MIELDRLRAAVRARARHWLLGEAPRATLPASPLPGALGVPAFRGDGGRAGPALAASPRWEHLGDDAAAREAHRLGAFAELARRAAGGDTAAEADAIALLEGWLRFDRPGVGVGWQHPTDAAVRLVHLAAGLAWLGAAAPVALREHAAGSAAWHLRHLQATLPLGEHDGHRRVAHHAGRLIGAFTFPAVPDARRTWSEAAVALAAELEALLYADGVDRSGAPRWLAQSAWLYALAFAVARANGAALPAAGNAAWARAVRYLDRLAGDAGTVPALGEAPFGEVLPMPGSLPGSLRTLAAGWGLDAGEPGPAPDARAAWFGLQGGEPSPAPKGWSAWSFAEDGVGIASFPTRAGALRVILHGAARSGGPLAHAAPAQLLLDLGDRPVLADPGPGEPERARHDGLGVHGRPPRGGGRVSARSYGKKASLEVDVPLSGAAVWQRHVALEQQRVRVTDRVQAATGPVELRWTFGPAWVLQGADASWSLRLDGLEVRVELAPTLRWSLEPGAQPVLVGRGELPPGGEVRCSFELR